MKTAKLFRHMEKRAWRHLAFWAGWVLGFAFIKGFGSSYEVYLGWFSYYILTLPIFVSHTYLLAYVLIPRYLNPRGAPVFILLFALTFYGFSVLELFLSNGFIYRWFPTGSELIEDYLAPGNVVRSGLGNLYIVLVFLAARTVRNWAVATRRQEELQGEDLRQQMQETMTRVQPLMLLYAIDHIDRMVERSDPEVTHAIALTSELLSEVMMYHEEGLRWLSREIELVRKLVALVSVFRGGKPEVEFFISGDPAMVQLPPMVLFSFIDLFFRRFDAKPDLPELTIEISGFSRMITVQVLKNGSWGEPDHMEECLDAIHRLAGRYAGQVDINVKKHSYGCSLIFRSAQEEDPSDVDSPEAGVVSPR